MVVFFEFISASLASIIAFFTGFSAFIVQYIAYFVKKFGVSKILIPIQITALTLYMAFVLVSVTYFITFVMKFWTKLKDLIHDFNTLGISVSGTSYGIANSQLVTSFWGFVHATGLDDALITSFGLFISLASAYFAIQTYKIVKYAYKELYTILVDLIKTTLI